MTGLIDVSNDAYMARVAVVDAMAFVSAPHVRMRPRVFPDGDQWCCLYGDDLQVGIAGFGETPAKACIAFDIAWDTTKTPAAMVASLPQPSTIEDRDG